MLLAIDVLCHLGEMLDHIKSTDLQSVFECKTSSPEDFQLEYIVSDQCFDNCWRTPKGIQQLEKDGRVVFMI